MRIALAAPIAGSLLIACNSIVGWGDLQEVNNPVANAGVDAGSANKDAGSSGGSTEAGTPDAGPRCNPNADFGKPVALGVAINTTANEANATLTADEQTMFFQRVTTGAAAIAILQIDRSGNDWGQPLPIVGLGDDSTHFGTPAISNDGLTLFVSQTPAGVSGPQLATATRGKRTDGFPAVTAFAPAASNPPLDFEPFIPADPSELYWVSKRDNLWFHVFRTAKDTGGNWSAASELEELRSTGTNAEGDQIEESAFVLSFDGLVAYYATNRTDGLGAYDIWRATRATKTSTFGNFQNLTSVNTPDYDAPSWISQDDCVLYLTHSGAGEPSDIYIATRGQ